MFKTLLIMFAACFCCAALASSPVWKVSHAGHHLYLGGTVHVLALDDFPLPAALEQAYQASSKIVFETDMALIQSLEFQAELLQSMMYTEGKSLKTELSASTFQALSDFSSSRGMPIDNLVGFKPVMVMMTLTMMELKRLGIAEAGVDAYFHGKAVSDNKQLGQLESVSEQLNFIASMGEGREDEFVKYSLNDIKYLPEVMKQLKSSWVTGDVQQLTEIAIVPLRNDFPKMYQNLLVNRNNNWLPKIVAMLNTDAVEFVLVGALHLAGDDGLLEQLRKKGYTVKALN